MSKVAERELLFLSLEQWVERYKPIINPFDDNASFDGFMFETYGEEFLYVCSQSSLNVWTLIEQDCKPVVESDGYVRDYEQFVVSGMAFVDRVGYFVTEEAFESGQLVYVKDC